MLRFGVAGLLPVCLLSVCLATALPVGTISAQTSAKKNTPGQRAGNAGAQSAKTKDCAAKWAAEEEFLADAYEQADEPWTPAERESDRRQFMIHCMKAK